MAPSTRRANKLKYKTPVKVEVTEEDRNPGVVYIGHVPHGFYEDQMQEYFKQFGDVMAIKLSRSKTSGKSKGYAFIKFRYAAVAKTVADTCQNYLFFNRLLKCSYRSMSEVHVDTFKSHPETPINKEKNKHNARKSDAIVHKSQKKAAKKLNHKMKLLSEAGVTVALDDICSISQDGEKSQDIPADKKATPKGKNQRGRKRGKPEDTSNDEQNAKSTLVKGNVADTSAPTPKKQKKADVPKTKKSSDTDTAAPTPKRQRKSDQPKTEMTNGSDKIVPTPKRQRKSDSPQIEKKGGISPKTKLVTASPSGKKAEGQGSAKKGKKSPSKVVVPLGVKKSDTGRKRK